MKRIDDLIDDPDYWSYIRYVAKERSFDGCTGVPEFYQDACLEHDLHYADAKTAFGDPITREESDERFRLVIQKRSCFRLFSPLSWWRWLGVRLLGKNAWNGHRLRK